MKVNLAATKTNLIRVKQTLELTREGYELLDQKRKILIAELTSIIHIAEKTQFQVQEAMRLAYAALDRATVVMGKRKLESLSFAMDISTSLGISHRRVMGVSIPDIDLKITEKPPYFSPHRVSSYVDETVARFKDVLKLLAELAEKRIAVMRLANEAQKTIRKVNALEKVYIPQYEESLKSIADRLDEESRESFSMLKMIKGRLRS